MYYLGAVCSPSGVSAGIGFAIPIDTVRRIVTQVTRMMFMRCLCAGLAAPERGATSLQAEYTTQGDQLIPCVTATRPAREFAVTVCSERPQHGLVTPVIFAIYIGGSVHQACDRNTHRRDRSSQTHTSARHTHQQRSMRGESHRLHPTPTSHWALWSPRPAYNTRSQLKARSSDGRRSDQTSPNHHTVRQPASVPIIQKYNTRHCRVSHVAMINIA
jgi:hypothetical protein